MKKRESGGDGDPNTITISRGLIFLAIEIPQRIGEPISAQSSDKQTTPIKHLSLRVVTHRLENFFFIANTSRIVGQLQTMSR
ncbi:MAG: hypothetical protein H6759_04905 [Candidatus Nomurabacteria bacterium]|nr:MAG: hypothetical protein H6759_04905 [Candidatus Nomurabacteria bacterium]